MRTSSEIRSVIISYFNCLVYGWNEVLSFSDLIIEDGVNIERDVNKYSIVGIFNVEACLQKIAGEMNLTINDVRYEFFCLHKEFGSLEEYSETSLFLNRFCHATNVLLNARASSRSSGKLKLDVESFIQHLSLKGAALNGMANRQKEFLYFILLASSVGYLRPKRFDNGLEKGVIEILSPHFDAEFVRSCLFGIWSDVVGLNQMFGGGGPYLFSPTSSRRGRVILIDGTYGSGKSTLALSLAADVAKRGGHCWVAPFEQTPSECEDLLVDLKILPPERSFAVIKDVVGFGDSFDDPTAADYQSGGVIILPTSKITVEQVMSDCAEMADVLSSERCRCIILDPINAIRDSSDYTDADGRTKIFQVIEKIRDLGINLIIVGEKDESNRIIPIMEKIADVVIQLSRDDKITGYTQRYIEITKSRAQREVRGLHPFTIRSEGGIQIYPGSAAVAARLKGRYQEPGGETTSFGWHEIDKTLGRDAFAEGDSIAIRGSAGSLKTELGLHFVTCVGTVPRTSSTKREISNLFVVLKENPNLIREKLRSKEMNIFRDIQRKNHKQVLDPDDVEVVSIATGYTQPGQIFQALESAIAAVRNRGRVVDRIVFANAEQWDLDSLFIKKDPVFTTVLLAYLRSSRITSMFLLSGEFQDKDTDPSILERIFSRSDVCLSLDEIDHSSSKRTVVHVLKSRGMHHVSEHFDLLNENGSLTVGNRSRLLRIIDGKVVGSISVNLHLHIEGELGHAYNTRIKRSLQPLLASKVNVDSGDRTQVMRAVGMSAYASADNLQILQIDEGRISECVGNSRRASKMHAFESSDFEKIFVESKSSNPLYSDDGTATLFPYLQNIALLASDQSVGLDRLNSWESLCNYVSKWETDCDPSGNDICFWFDCGKIETYVCFFLEVCLSCGASGPIKSTKFGKWLRENEGFMAASIDRFWLLGHRAHRLRPLGSVLQSCQVSGYDPNKKNPLIWRHWFSSLSEMLEKFPRDSLESLEISLLPGGVAVAGQWYLGIPLYSASPAVGYQLIQSLISPCEQEVRVNEGIGLPTLMRYYEDRKGGTLSCRNFELPADETLSSLRSALRRSDFTDYRYVAEKVGFHLKKCLDVKDGLHSGKESLRKRFRVMVDELDREAWR